MLGMMMLLLILNIQPLPTILVFRPPTTHLVPLEQRWLQLEFGCPAMKVRRSKLEMLRAAMA